MGKMSARLRSRQGQALVEMVMVLPVLLLIFAGVVDIGRVYDQQLLVNEAAREGARLAAVGKTDTEVQAAVTQYKRYEGALKATVDRTSATQVTVTVDGKVELFMPVMQHIFTSPCPVKASATMPKA